MTVRTYWFFPVFSEASGNLDLQPFARFDQIDACRPRAMYATHSTGKRRDSRVDQTVTRSLNSSRKSCGKPGTLSRSSTDS